ncbi:MAG: glycosyltransferase [Armatimonadota bacterium]|nr:glycosyltransferase [Armatimonadota bacterium]
MALTIGMFTDSYRPRISGVVHSVGTLARCLRARGHRVHIFAPHYPGQVDDEPDVHRLPSLVIGKNRDFPVLLPTVGPLRRIERELGLDVLHAHSPFVAGHLAMRVRDGRPVVFTHHTLYAEYVHYAPGIPSPLARWWVRRRVRRFCDRCDVVIVPTRVIGRMLRDHGVRARIDVIPTAVLDLNAIGRIPPISREPFGDAPLVVCAGRMAPEKSMDLVLEAFAVARARHPAHLVMVGGGPALPQLQGLAVRMGIADHVTFVGELPYESAIAWMKAADVFAFASQTETQGLVVLEAMACGVPVVVVAAAGVVEAVEHGQTGLLTEPDPVSLGEAIGRVLADEDLRRTLGEGGRRAAQAYSAEAVTERTLRVYASVAGGTG